MSQVQALVQRVIDARQTAAAAVAVTQQLEADHLAAHAASYEAKAAAQKELAEAETALREAALAEYITSGSKAPAPGIGIRITKALQYSADEALVWAKASGIALQLDKKAFEKVAPAAGLPFVTTVETPTATIATDLAAAQQVAA